MIDIRNPQFFVFANAAARPAAAAGDPRRWFTMKAAEGTGEIVIYGEIGTSWWDDSAMSAKDFDDAVKDLGDVGTINVRINSPGGDAFDGIAIYNILRNHKATVNVTVDGIAASAASIIAMAGDTITMPQNAFMLIHGASALAIGDAEAMQSMAEDLRRLDQAIVQTYVARSGADETKISAIMKEDRLMSASEAKDLGLADEVKDAVKMAAKFPLRLLPKAVADKIRAVAEDVSDEPSPPEASEDGGEGGSTEPPEPSTEGEPSNVIELRTKAKAEGRQEYAAYVAEVLDVCNLAKAPHRASAFIKDQVDIKTIRARLLTARAEEEERAPVNPHVPASIGAKTGDRWSAIMQRMGIAKK